jgi:SAM-dependent methyltransferase
MGSEDVYATARPGLRARAASIAARRARGRRHERLFALTGVTPGSRIVDVGCGRIGLRRHEPGHDITGVDVGDRPDYPGPFVRADATRGLPFADGEFDLAYCSSVIEHVPRDLRPVFARELRRVARGWYVQTPAFSFPVEPHALLPAAHWLPTGLRRRYWSLGVAGEWEDIALLRRAEMAALFGDPVAERIGPLVKSWVSIRSVRGGSSETPDPPDGVGSARYRG